MAKVRSVMAVGGIKEDPISKIAKGGKVSKSDAAASMDKSNNESRTKKIALVQGGVKDGKTGKSASYVYEKLPTEKDFDVKRHRETVYNENLPLLRKTAEYQEYRRSLSKNK